MRGMLRCSAVLLASLLLAGAAGADDGPLGGIGVIEGRDTATHVLTIDGRDYTVLATTLLRGREGQVLRFEQLPVAVERDGVISGRAEATCRFEARGSAGAYTLLKLRLIEPPR